MIIDTASIAKDFIENYHQRLEEEYISPEFLQKQKCVNLVHTLQ